MKKSSSKLEKKKKKNDDYYEYEVPDRKNTVIKRLPKSDAPEAIGVLARAYMTEQRAIRIIEKEPKKLEILTAFFTAVVNELLNEPNCRISAVYVEGKIAGVSIHQLGSKTKGVVPFWKQMRVMLKMTMKGSFQTIKNFHKTVEAAQQVSSATMEKRNTWQIYWIGVDIPFRRKGYATMLINFILSRLKQEESMGCMAVVFNEELVSMFQKCGFQLSAALQKPVPFWIVSKSPEMNPLLETKSTEVIKNITIKHQIGEGKFGEVYLGDWEGTPVAMKKLHNQTEVAAFTKEAQLLMSLAHPHIVRCLGIHIESSGDKYMVVEYVDGGSLVSLLRKKQADLTLDNLLQMAIGAARGLVYLESKKVVHRDISARNLLVDSNYHVKVSDFGMSRVYTDFYQSSQSTALPIRWSAPEVIQQGPTTSAADVFSFGVTLWEIFEFGMIPHVNLSNQEVAKKVCKPDIDNEPILYRPNKCPEEVYDLMKRCWRYDPNSRPSFKEILLELELIRGGDDSEELSRSDSLDDSVHYQYTHSAWIENQP